MKTYIYYNKFDSKKEPQGRVEADNVFGMTYAEAQRRAKDSLARIQQEKGETLKLTSSFVVDYKRTHDSKW